MAETHTHAHARTCYKVLGMYSYNQDLVLDEELGPGPRPGIRTMLVVNLVVDLKLPLLYLDPGLVLVPVLDQLLALNLKLLLDVELDWTQS